MEGKQGCIRCFAVGPVCPNKSVTMYYVFRKYKRDSTFRVSGVLQLAKTGPPVTKHRPLLCLVPSDAMMAWRLYTPSDVNRTNLHVLTAPGMSHILTWIGQLWSSRKKFVRASPQPKLENYESMQHRLQFSGIKKGAKISFHRHFNYPWVKYGVQHLWDPMIVTDHWPVYSLRGWSWKLCQITACTDSYCMHQSSHWSAFNL